jgi:hypothetical protein
VFVLPDGVESKGELFAAVAATMLLDPPLGPNHVWDALRDSLWEGLSELPDERVAIAWPDALALADADPASFETAVAILNDLIRSLADSMATQRPPKAVSIIIGS